MTIELTIEQMAPHGEGIARLPQGDIVFVPGALQGERVLAQIHTTEIPHQAQLEEILTPNPDRIEPPCPHFPLCGGCRLQHWREQAVATWKTQRLEEHLRKAGWKETIPLRAPIVAERATRRRARLALFRPRRSNSAILGFNAWHSHDIVDLDRCPVLTPDLEAFVGRLRACIVAWLPPGAHCDAQITALEGQIDLVLIGGPPLGLEQRQALADVAQTLDIAQLSWRKWDKTPLEPIALRRPMALTYGQKPHGQTRVPFPAGSFLQATQTGENALIAFAAKAAESATSVMDLFCGLGAFGLSMPQAQRVAFSDMNGQALNALERATQHDPRWRVQQRDLLRDPYSADELNAFDAVVFDPPRGGAKALAAALAQSKVRTVVAISCDPASFARDAALLAQGGYRLLAVQPVDQFLWSTHLELAAHFVKT